MEKWSVKGEPRVVLITEKDLAAGEEITYNYRSDGSSNVVDGEELTKQRCCCGAANCAGFIGGKTKDMGAGAGMDDTQREAKAAQEWLSRARRALEAPRSCMPPEELLMLRSALGDSGRTAAKAMHDPQDLWDSGRGGEGGIGDAALDAVRIGGLPDYRPGLFGVRLAKDFPPHGLFEGEVVGVRKGIGKGGHSKTTAQESKTDTAATVVALYTVVYEDGDREDFELHQLRPLLLQWQQLPLATLAMGGATIQRKVKGGRAPAEEAALCQVCGRGDGEESMLLCGDGEGHGCDKGFHIYCLKPALNSLPEDDWYCGDCEGAEGNARAKALAANATAVAAAAEVAETTEVERARERQGLVGRPLQVYWPEDKAWYTGRVSKRRDKRSRPKGDSWTKSGDHGRGGASGTEYQVHYADDEKEWVDLVGGQHKWRFLPDDHLDGNGKDERRVVTALTDGPQTGGTAKDDAAAARLLGSRKSGRRVGGDGDEPCSKKQNRPGVQPGTGTGDARTVGAEDASGAASARGDGPGKQRVALKVLHQLMGVGGGEGPAGLGIEEGTLEVVELQALLLLAEEADCVMDRFLEGYAEELQVGYNGSGGAGDSRRISAAEVDAAAAEALSKVPSWLRLDSAEQLRRRLVQSEKVNKKVSALVQQAQARGQTGVCELELLRSGKADSPAAATAIASGKSGGSGGSRPHLRDLSRALAQAEVVAKSGLVVDALDGLQAMVDAVDEWVVQVQRLLLPRTGYGEDEYDLLCCMNMDLLCMACTQLTIPLISHLPITHPLPTPSPILTHHPPIIHPVHVPIHRTNHPPLTCAHTPYITHVQDVSMIRTTAYWRQRCWQYWRRRRRRQRRRSGVTLCGRPNGGSIGRAGSRRSSMRRRNSCPRYQCSRRSRKRKSLTRRRRRRSRRRRRCDQQQQQQQQSLVRAQR
jgi:hypothetical protein